VKEKTRKIICKP